MKYLVFTGIHQEPARICDGVALCNQCNEYLVDEVWNHDPEVHESRAHCPTCGTEFALYYELVLSGVTKR